MNSNYLNNKLKIIERRNPLPDRILLRSYKLKLRDPLVTAEEVNTVYNTPGYLKGADIDYAGAYMYINAQNNLMTAKSDYFISYTTDELYYLQLYACAWLMGAFQPRTKQQGKIIGNLPNHKNFQKLDLFGQLYCYLDYNGWAVTSGGTKATFGGVGTSNGGCGWNY